MMNIKKRNCITPPSLLPSTIAYSKYQNSLESVLTKMSTGRRFIQTIPMMTTGNTLYRCRSWYSRSHLSLGEAARRFLAESIQ
eukprot:scaffold151411_cov35-Attheya_sp.AAC.1